MPRSTPTEAPDIASPPAARPVPAGAGVIARWLPWLLALGGLVGGAAALALMLERLAVLADPDHIPTCSINPVLSCGSVMATPQAEAFGFPNPLLGIAGFAIVVTVGVGLLAGATYRRWFWIGLQVGVTFGVGFVHWLIFQSLYRIGALCPYCMVVWAVTIPVFWYVTLHNLNRGILRVPDPVQVLVRSLTRNHGVVLTAWGLGIVLLVAQRFWSYWSQLLAVLG